MSFLSKFTCRCQFTNHLIKISVIRLSMNKLCSATKLAFRKVSHVIFDLDGLLLDTESVYFRVFSEIAQRHGKKYTHAIRAKVIGTTETDSAIIAVREMKLPISPETFLELFKTMADKSLRDVKLMPGAERIVRHLHSNKVPLAVATSSGLDTYEIKTAKHAEFFKMFSHVVTGGSDPEVKRGKPSPEIFLVCAGRFKDKPQPAHCLVFEDAPNGVEAAISAGMQVVMVPDKLTDEKLCKKATLKLDSLEQVKPELFGLPAFK